MPRILIKPSPAHKTPSGAVPIKTTPTKLNGVRIIEPRIFRDEWGYFLETWRRDRHHAAGIPYRFVQDNVSVSTKGVLRGLHFQEPTGQAKLVSFLEGEIIDVAVDIRVGSPTFLRWEGVVLSSETGRQLFIPEGFAHGFAVLSDVAIVMYKCTNFYDPASEQGLRWDDRAFGIQWPINEPKLSPKDRASPRISQIPTSYLPRNVKQT